ncbi:MAG: ABC transporter substrate-binding protein, partial [Oscillospiraceae bacterium]|nr:ABC transporter substrate-binding protein [Oscillospiraceae bacterium]
MNTKRFIAASLAAIMAVTTLSACNQSAVSGKAAEVAKRDKDYNLDTPLVVAYEEFSGKFSPFFAETLYDQTAVDMTQVSIVTTDRVGDIVFNAIEGETRAYNGADYFYNGPANIKMVYDEAADITTYNFKLRNDLTFSDGEKLTIDDLIFTYYVFLDPSYDGNAVLYSENIKGLTSYRLKVSEDVIDRMTPVFGKIWEAGMGYTGPFADFTKEQYDLVYGELVDQQWKTEVQKIVSYVKGNLAGYVEDLGGTSADLESEGWQVALGMYAWGFGEPGENGGITANGKTYDLKTTFPTIDDYVDATKAAYEDDFAAFADVELVDGAEGVDGVKNLFIKSQQDASVDESAFNHISGIERINDYEMTITINGFSATAIYRMAGSIAPLHYYGDKSLYDYENGKFGFPFGDLSSVHARDGQPLGAGPYTFNRYENKVIYYDANEKFFNGAPYIKNLQFKETTEDEKIQAIDTGSADIAEPQFSKLAAEEISKLNPNGELTGEKITFTSVADLGYSYIGINADKVRVGSDSASEASRNLRKAIGTIISVYRETVADSYFGPAAIVINYPISLTSWAAPQKTDDGYRV